MEKNYVLQETINPDMSLQNFSWQSDSNNATLMWDWPIEREIRFALIFSCENENPDISKLLNDKHPHDVVMRDLASNFVTTLSEARCKFLICPAHFNNDKTISVCPPALMTDWVYKKFEVAASTIYSPLQLSRYQKVSLTIETNSDVELLSKALTYAIYEDDMPIASYPIDAHLLAHGGHMYIQKNQTVEFVLHSDYEHLFQLK